VFFLKRLVFYRYQSNSNFPLLFIIVTSKKSNLLPPISILLDHKNNYAERLSIDNNAAFNSLHRKDDFAKRSKILLDTDLKIILTIKLILLKS